MPKIEPFRSSLLAKAKDLFQISTSRSVADLEQLLQEFKLTKYLISSQVHSDKIFIAENITTSRHLNGYDGFITKQNNLALIIKTADCCPVFIYDQKQKIIANLHAGRRSTEAGIVYKALDILLKDFRSNPADLLCSLGPAICVNCYQINREKDLHFDLWGENKEQILSQQVPEKNLEISGLCTSCNAHDRFYSFRRDKTEQRCYNVLMLL